MRRQRSFRPQQLVNKFTKLHIKCSARSWAPMVTGRRGRFFQRKTKTRDRSKTITAFIFGNEITGDLGIFLQIYLCFSEFSTMYFITFTTRKKKVCYFVEVRLCFKDQASCLPILSVSKLYSFYSKASQNSVSSTAALRRQVWGEVPLPG